MHIKVKIKGLTPLLMSRFTEHAEVAVSSGSRVSISAKSSTPREEAASRCYKDDDGWLFIPGTNIFAAIIAAGTFHKVGKSKLTTMKTSLIPAGLSVIDLVCPLNTKDWEVDSRSVVIPSTGGRIMCHRPRLDEWSTTFTLEIDEEMFNEKVVRILVTDAGKKLGIGDYRPQRKGPFGRFGIIGWELSE
jgi:hypothetical protein